MFTHKPASTSGLEAARDEALRLLDAEPIGSETRASLKAEVLEFSEAIVKEKREPLSFNHVVPAVATVLSVLIVTDFERLNVVTSKAVQFLPKLMK